MTHAEQNRRQINNHQMIETTGQISYAYAYKDGNIDVVGGSLLVPGGSVPK